MSGVAEVGFFFTVDVVPVEEVVRTPADDDDDVVDVVLVCAEAVAPAMAAAATASAPKIESVWMRVIVVSIRVNARSGSRVPFGEDFGCGESHAVGRGVGRRRHGGLRRAGNAGEQLDAHQHREV